MIKSLRPVCSKIPLSVSPLPHHHCFPHCLSPHPCSLPFSISGDLYTWKHGTLSLGLFSQDSSLVKTLITALNWSHTIWLKSVFFKCQMSCVNYWIHSSFLPGSQKWLHMLHLFIDCDKITTFHSNYGSNFLKKLPLKETLILVTFQPTFQFSTICWPMCTYVYLKWYWMRWTHDLSSVLYQAIFLLLGIAFFIYMVQNRN